MQTLLPNRRSLIATLLIVAAILGILFAMGRPPMCACGTIKFWQGVVQSPENSQMITDWYSASHLIHGLLFYFFAHILWRRWRLFGGLPTKWALPIAVAFEGFWEILENSPIIINRYREVTVSWGYSGDSIVNSMSDIGWMVIGFLIASKLPSWASVALAVALELFCLVMIRDNLTLNILMLVYPIPAIATWQGGA